MRKRILVVTLLMVMAGLGFTINNCYAKSSDSVKLRWASFIPGNHPLLSLYKECGEEIEKRTGGKVTFTYFPSQTLLKAKEIYTGIQKGVADIGLGVLAYHRGRFPSMDALELPLGYPNGVVATKVVNDFYDKFMPKELSDVKVLILTGCGPSLLSTKTPVRTLEDLNGMKIRATGVGGKVVKPLGAVPVGMPLPNIYEALQRGVVEGYISTVESLKTWNLADVIKSSTSSPSIAYTSVIYIVMKKNKFDSLPPDVKEVIDSVNRSFIPRYGELWDKMDEEGKNLSISRGNKWIELSTEESSRWAEKIQPVIDEYILEAQENGLPGREYVDFIKSRIKAYSGE